MPLWTAAGETFDSRVVGSNPSRLTTLGSHHMGAIQHNNFDHPDELRRYGRHQVKGLERPIDVYRLLP